MCPQITAFSPRQAKALPRGGLSLLECFPVCLTPKSIKFNRFLKLSLLEYQPPLACFGFVTSQKWLVSGKISLRKRLNLIDVGAECALPLRPVDEVLQVMSLNVEVEALVNGAPCEPLVQVMLLFNFIRTSIPEEYDLMPSWHRFCRS